MGDFKKLKNSYSQLVNNLSNSKGFDAHKYLRKFHSISESDFYLDEIYLNEINDLLQSSFEAENVDFENYEKWLINGD